MAGRIASRGSDQFMVRFPEGMRDEIKRLADENGRSMNSEIIDRLKFALEHSGIDVDELLNTLQEQNHLSAQMRSMFENDRTVARSVLWHILGYADQIPADLLVWADSMLHILDPSTPYDQFGDDESGELTEEEHEKLVQEAKERYQAHLDAAIDKVYARRGLPSRRQEE